MLTICFCYRPGRNRQDIPGRMSWSGHVKSWSHQSHCFVCPAVEAGESLDICQDLREKLGLTFGLFMMLYLFSPEFFDI